MQRVDLGESIHRSLMCFEPFIAFTSKADLIIDASLVPTKT